jgi:signal transduction histidine kinase
MLLATWIAAIHFGIVRADIASAFAANLASNLISLTEPVLCAAACFWAARKSHAHIRTSWNLLGLGAASWAAGQAIWAYYEVVLGQEVPFPSLADAGYLGFVPLAAAGILVYSAPSLQRGDRARFILDGLLIVGALLLMTWVGALDATIQSIVSTDEPLPLWESLVLGASPVGDFLIVSLVLLLLVRVESQVKASVLLVGLGVTVFAFADTVYFVMINQGTYYTGHIIDLGWGVGFLVIGLAALRSGQIGGTPEPLRASAERVVAYLPYLPLGFCLLLVADHAYEVGGLQPGLLLSLLTLVVLVLLRQLYILFENQRLNRELAMTSRRLEEVQELRRQLLNNIVHDLRTPLTPLKIHLHLLAQADPPLGPDPARSVKVLQSSSKQFENLVNDLQDVFKLESNQLRLVLAPTDIAALVAQACDGSRELAKAQGITFSVDTSPNLVANVDASRIMQVVQNLLSNAFKFTPTGGRIEVKAAAAAGGIRVSVHDSGRGLSPEEKSRLFQPFSQVHERTETKERGTGLGLYISRGIIEQHQGRVWVDSAGRGFGSTFAFELVPFLDAAAPAARTVSGP